jgi:hypothetical protein
MSSGFLRGRSLLVCCPPYPPKWTLHVSGEIVYISGRPFVLRDSSEPRKTLPLSDRPESLEAIEQRLKSDILAEGVRCDCLIFSPCICAVYVSLLQVWWPRLDAQ